MSPKNKVLIIGSSGYLGHAIGRAFVRHGWQTYGLIRNEKHTTRLASEEMIPVLGSLNDPSLATTLENQAQYFNAVVVTVEDLANYIPLLNSIINLSRAISTFSANHGIRPLILLSSGLKDFGETGLHGSPNLRPITEASPLNPPPAIRERAEACGRILDHADAFDAVVVRPSNLYGLSGTMYAYFFKLAEAAVRRGGALVLPADAKTILHSTHVDDCAEAYVALADEGRRGEVKQQLFNIAATRYETLEEIGAALVKEFGIPGGVRFEPAARDSAQGLDYFIVGFSEWISSEKIRKVTGWSDRRVAFTEGIHVYRRAFEAAVAQGHPGIQTLEAHAVQNQ